MANRTSRTRPTRSARSSRAAKPARRGAPRRRLITVEDLRALRVVSAPALSPDGGQVVFLVKELGEKNADRTRLWVADAAGGAARPLTSGERDGRAAWSHDGRTLAFVRSREKGRPQVALLPAGGGEAVDLTCLPEGAISALRWSPAGDALYISFRATAPEWTAAAIELRKSRGESDPPRVIDEPWYRLDGDGYFNAQRFVLMRVDLADGATRTLWDRDTLGSFSFDISPDGRTVALATTRDPKAFARDWTNELLLLDAGSGRVRTLPGLPPGPKPSPLFSPDGRRIAWAGVIDADGSRTSDNFELFVSDARTGGARSLTRSTDQCLIAPTLGDCAEVDFAPHFAWHPDGKRLWVQIGWHGETHLATVAAGGGPPCLHTRGRCQVRLGTLSRDGRRIAVTVESATRPPEVHLAELPRLVGRAPQALLRLRAASDANGALFAQIRLAAPRATWVRSDDGTRVHTFTLLPPGASAARRRPTILEIHGGPQAQYGYSFFHEFQVLAAAGHAVVYSNPRGSKGYGRAVCAGIHRAWGTKDWEDVRAVSGWAAGQPFCNPRRLGVMGGSFGGYMTLWAVGHSRAYRAAIADRCVSNLVSMWGSSDVSVWPDTSFPGNAWDDTRALWDMSPLQFMGRVRTPVLLIHSEGDLRCNVAESEQVHSALAIRGVPVRFVRYPRSTSHGMSRNGPADLRIHRLEQILGWWRRWMT